MRTILLAIIVALPANSAAVSPNAAIYIPPKPSLTTQLAAKEIRRYFYLRTGVLASVTSWRPGSAPADISFFLVKNGEELRTVPAWVDVPAISGEECYALRTSTGSGKRAHVIVGGGEPGILYGAYACVEQMGVRFDVHGDAIPDRRIDPRSFTLPAREGRPLFGIRGIQPFHDFPEGPDWWTEEDYKAILAQLPKLGMNFIGFHTYPEHGLGPEPLVWIGLKEEIGPRGDVRASYRARHFTNANGTWGYAARATSSYANGFGDLFPADQYGSSYALGKSEWPADSAEENALFNTTGEFFARAFRFGRELGIRTCVGTETPLTVPAAVKNRLRARGLNPDDSSTTQLLYEGIFDRIRRTYPIDYYWLWTPEDWTWRLNSAEELERTRQDLAAALRAARSVNAPFTLATCGWVLGPASDRSYFDRFLPKESPMSCINRYVGFEPVEAGFAKAAGRPLWAIPWLEDDPALSIPQLWAGRMRRDAADALAYGCTGLIGIHWRTRILGPNVAALAAAAWAQPGHPRIGDFYLDWARANFGDERAVEIGGLFARIDGGPEFRPELGYRAHLPRPADWMDGPGGMRADTLAWEERAGDYRFVDTLERMRAGVVGNGNLERFDYWLNSFRYLRESGKFSCTGGEIQRLIERARKSPEQGRATYRNAFIALRERQIGEMERALGWFVRTMSTKGDLGTVANWQQHIRDVSLERSARQIDTLTGGPLPDGCWPRAETLDMRKMIIPTVRSSLRKGEGLRLEALFYGKRPERVVVRWRPVGRGAMRSSTFAHVARNVFSLSIPAERIHGDLEYRIEAEWPDGLREVYPSTAPTMNQTVVVF